MYKDILPAIAGIHIYPVVSLVLFVVVFAGVLAAVGRMDDATVDRLAGLPLDGVDERPAGEARR